MDEGRRDPAFQMDDALQARRGAQTLPHGVPARENEQAGAVSYKVAAER